MRRRDFLTLAGATAATWPLAGRAQQALPVPRGPGGRPWLIGALINQTKAQSDIDSLGPFVHGMTKLGYVEGRDYRIEARYTDGDGTRIPALATSIVALAPDLVLARSNGAPAIHALTKTIPIMSGNLNPENLEGMVGNNLARPIGNVTGIALDLVLLTGKHCDLALELVPRASRIGVIVSPLDVGAAATREQVAAAAKVRMFTPVMIDVAQPEEIEAGFRAMGTAGVDAIVAGPSGAMSADRARTASAAAAVRLPTIYNEQGYVEAGGLISYGFDRKATWERLAAYAVRIFEGAKPADLPVEQTINYLMAINLKTAKSVGLTIPPSVLFRADIVLD